MVALFEEVSLFMYVCELFVKKKKSEEKMENVNIKDNKKYLVAGRLFCLSELQTDFTNCFPLFFITVHFNLLSKNMPVI